MYLHLICCSLVILLSWGHTGVCSVCSSAYGNVTELNLSNKSLSGTNCGTFPPIPSLNKLNLSHNRFQFLPRFFLTNVTNVTVLDLSHNRILTLSKKTLANATHLQEIYLQNNQLGRIEVEIFALFRNLTLLNLMNNPDFCLFCESKRLEEDNFQWERNTSCLSDSCHSDNCQTCVVRLLCEERSTASLLPTATSISTESERESNPLSTEITTKSTSLEKNSLDETKPTPTGSLSDRDKHQTLKATEENSPDWFEDFTILLTCPSLHSCMMYGLIGLIMNVLTLFLCFKMNYHLKVSLVSVEF